MGQYNGKILANDDYKPAAASLLRPYISEQNYWVLQHHEVWFWFAQFHFQSKIHLKTMVNWVLQHHEVSRYCFEDHHGSP